MTDYKTLSPEYVQRIAPYQAGKPIAELAREFGINEADIIKLASNENPLGPSPAAKAAIAAAAADLTRYPDANGFELKAVLAKRFGVGLDNVVLGNGSNDILELAAQAYLQPGQSAVYSQYSFAVYPLATQARGGRGIVVPATKDFGHDLQAMRAAIQPDTRLVFVANPNNPTGTFLPPADLDAFLASVPPEVLVVLDQAYNEYLPPEARYDSVPWLAKYPNLIISRTFSKAFGLAAIRIGFGLMHADVAAMMNRVRQPFNVNQLAQAAAIAALGDSEYLARSYQLNREGMAFLEAGFRELGLPYVPSFGNFILVEVGDGAAVNLALLRRGVIVRPVGSYDLPQHLRVTIGLPEENARFLAALKDALAEVSGAAAKAA